MFDDLLVRLQTTGLDDLLVALLILVVGWLVALVISGVVRMLLHRTKVDDRIARWVQGDETTGPTTDAPRIERIISTIVFWLIMLLVIVAVFDRLSLPGVTGPLNSFLTEIFVFLPRLLSAAFLMLIAWVIATVLRIVVRAALNAVKFDERLSQEADVQTAGSTPHVDAQGRPVDAQGKPVPSLSGTIANTIYWLVLLFFLPAILDALGLNGLLAPVQGLLNDVLRFLPDIALAALILVVGWFVARIVQRIVSNLLYATGIDNLGEEMGLSSMAGNRRLSEVLGFIAYLLVLLVVATIALDTLNLGAITEPISNMLDRILTSIPNIFAAILLLLLAYVAGRLVSGLVTNILAGLGFDSIIERLGVGMSGDMNQPTTPDMAAADVSGRRSPSEIAGYVVLVAIMLFATIEALELIGFESLATLVATFTVFAGQVLLGLLIFGVGLYIANLAANVIWSSAGKNAGLLALAARISILVLAGAMALRQMGLAPEIIQTAFTLLLGAVAVAVALAFGLGSRDVAGQVVADWQQKLEQGRGTDVNPYTGTKEAGPD